MSAISENFNESKYGVTLFLFSNCNMREYPDNNPASFSNIFSHRVNLDHGTSYEIALANIHLPSYINTVIKNDFLESYIEYRLGKFDFNEVTSQYELDQQSSKKLFRLAPNKSISGLYSKNNEKIYDDQDAVSLITKGNSGKKLSHRKLFVICPQV